MEAGHLSTFKGQSNSVRLSPITLFLLGLVKCSFDKTLFGASLSVLASERLVYRSSGCWSLMGSPCCGTYSTSFKYKSSIAA